MSVFNFFFNKTTRNIIKEDTIKESDDKVRARRASYLLWGSCLFRVETLPEEKLTKIKYVLKNVGSSLNILRKEVLLLHIFSYYFAISMKMVDGNADMTLLRSLFLAEAEKFLSTLNAQKWGGASDLAPRLQRYESAISDYAAELQISGEDGNILDAVGQVFYPNLLNHGYKGDIRLEDARRMKEFTDILIKDCLSSIGIALQKLRDEGIIP